MTPMSFFFFSIFWAEERRTYLPQNSTFSGAPFEEPGRSFRRPAYSTASSSLNTQNPPQPVPDEGRGPPQKHVAAHGMSEIGFLIRKEAVE